MIPGHHGLLDLEELLNQEPCPNCGERGFDRGESVLNPGGWESVPATCRHCGFKIEKRRFSSR